MALVAFPGAAPLPFGIGAHTITTTFPQTSSAGTIDAAAEAVVCIGRIQTSDGASHTIDTTGSSALHWKTGNATFANAGTTVVVGLAAVDTATGPVGRAVNVTDVITMDVSLSLTGGGGGIAGSSWQTHVPTAGTKTIANGDFVGFAVQMTARGGADTLQVAATQGLGNALMAPFISTFTAAAYGAANGGPIALIVFSDGAFGWFYGTDLVSSITARTFNSGSATVEYGQLYNFPFPYRVSGLYGWIAPGADCDIVLYSDPLGTPVAQKTISLDANAVSSATGRRFLIPFSSSYDVAASTPVAALYKPGASNISAYYKTLANAAHRVTDMGGTDSYGVSRASGAFANANSSLDHYYIGLMVSAVDNGAGGGGGAPGHGNMTGGLQ